MAVRVHASTRYAHRSAPPGPMRATRTFVVLPPDSTVTAQTSPPGAAVTSPSVTTPGLFGSAKTVVHATPALRPSVCPTVTRCADGAVAVP